MEYFELTFTFSFIFFFFFEWKNERNVRMWKYTYMNGMLQVLMVFNCVRIVLKANIQWKEINKWKKHGQRTNHAGCRVSFSHDRRISDHLFSSFIRLILIEIFIMSAKSVIEYVFCFVDRECLEPCSTVFCHICNWFCYFFFAPILNCRNK